LDQGWSPQCENFASKSPDTWAVIKTTAVQPLSFVEEENKQLPSTLTPRPELEVLAGDILVTRAGPRARAGVCCLVRSARPRLMICDKVYRLRIDTRAASPRFIELTLNAPSLMSEIDAIKTGTSDSGVNLTQDRFLDLQIRLPTLSEQEETIRRVDSLFTLSTAVERRLRSAVKCAAGLERAILSRAFSGGLVATEADLARAEGRPYESARELLTRVNTDTAPSIAVASPRAARARRRTRA
jgi:type I restriction enzyme S subunit